MRHYVFNSTFSGTTQVSWYQKGKPIWILLKKETASGSGISWAVCKSAPCSKQITMPAPHNSVFLQARRRSSHPSNSVKALKTKHCALQTAETEQNKCCNKCLFYFTFSLCSSRVSSIFAVTLRHLCGERRWDRDKVESSGAIVDRHLLALALVLAVAEALVHEAFQWKPAPHQHSWTTQHSRWYLKPILFT